MIDQSLLGITHDEQQKAVEQIQELMAQGISTGEAITIVARELREKQQQEREAKEKQKNIES